MSNPIKITNLTSNSLSPIQVKYCTGFFERLRGFTFRKKLAIDEGLILVEKRDSRLDTSIHMLFVWTDLAVFWINSQLTIVDKTLAKSWHPYYASRSPARYVLELHPSQMEVFQIGDQLEFANE
jgi:uncharacterized membrane protein (UPF0127 family)